MRLGQIKWRGAATAAIFNHVTARPIPDYTLYDLICRAEREGLPLAELAEELSIAKPVAAEPLIPLKPREVWAHGSTYDTSHRERPQIFLKGTARVCVGPGQDIGIRPDSRFTAPEPELAIVLGARGRVLGYTLANDVSAWDIEREHPLYLAQSKTFHASCALGPVIVTADEIAADEATVCCTILRNGEEIFSGQASTEGLGIERMIEFLMRANPVPPGSVLLTGAGIAIGEDAALEAGDSVTIRAECIGELTNFAALIAETELSSRRAGASSV
ncbi:MAG: fumarylacetoacetate hydrolase family protein [Bryobacteraceae bacterium]